MKVGDSIKKNKKRSPKVLRANISNKNNGTNAIKLKPALTHVNLLSHQLLKALWKFYKCKVRLFPARLEMTKQNGQR